MAGMYGNTVSSFGEKLVVCYNVTCWQVLHGNEDHKLGNENENKIDFQHPVLSDIMLAGICDDHHFGSGDVNIHGRLKTKF